MKKIILSVLALIIAGAGIVFALQNKPENTNNGKILIAYYSLSGNTKYIAEKIHSQVGGDIFEIKTVKPYPTDHDQMLQTVRRELDEGKLPELQNYPQNIGQYNVIFIGTPVWFGQMSNPVRAFITKTDFKGKTIVPFITHGGGGEGNIPEEMGKLANTKYLEPFVVANRGNDSTDNDIKAWLKILKY